VARWLLGCSAAGGTGSRRLTGGLVPSITEAAVDLLLSTPDPLAGHAAGVLSHAIGSLAAPGPGVSPPAPDLAVVGFPREHAGCVLLPVGLPAALKALAIDGSRTCKAGELLSVEG